MHEKPETEPEIQTVGPWKYQVACCESNNWAENKVRFDTPELAAVGARELMDRWMGCDLARVVPTETPSVEPVDMADKSIIIDERTVPNPRRGGIKVVYSSPVNRR